MSIQKCNSCSYQFKWKEVQSATLWSYKPLVCRECGLEHRLTWFSRIFPGILFPLLLIPLAFNIDKGLADLLFILYVSLIVIDMLISPYYEKYRHIQSLNKNKKG